jgi:hypothetical protein
VLELFAYGDTGKQENCCTATYRMSSSKLRSGKHKDMKTKE